MMQIKRADDIEVKLDEADEQAEATSARYAHNEVFDKLRGITDGKEPLQA